MASSSAGYGRRDIPWKSGIEADVNECVFDLENALRSIALAVSLT